MRVDHVCDLWLLPDLAPFGLSLDSVLTDLCYRTRSRRTGQFNDRRIYRYADVLRDIENTQQGT
jgi:hypothetical protein